MAQRPYPTNQYAQNVTVYPAPGGATVYPPPGGTTVYTTGPAGQQAPTVVVQQPPTVVVKQRRGILGQIGHELNTLGKVVSREANWTATEINKALSTTATGNVLSLFQSGNIVQLVSRASGRSLEIVQGPTGQLVVDGLGPDGAPNATWTVVNEGGNQVRLHNNNNFLCIMNGNTMVIPMPPGATHGVETKFQLTQSGVFIHLESMKERGKHIGIVPTGQLKAALACGKEQHSQFGVKLLHSPFGVQK